MSAPEATRGPLPHYLTVRQVAALLQCCPQTVRNWCKRGLFPAPLVIGRRKRLWNADAVRAALEHPELPGGKAG